MSSYNQERVLCDTMILDERWAIATGTVLSGNATGDALTQVVEELGLDIIRALSGSKASIDELRQEVVSANALDREAVERSGGDIDNLDDGADYREALARRIAHHSGRLALNAVKKRRNRYLAGPVSRGGWSAPDLSKFGVY